MKMLRLDTIEDVVSITLNGCDYAVTVDGNGSVPCLCMGIGSLLQKTLSSQFRQTFRIYSSDLYWAKSQYEGIKQITIESLCCDVIEVAAQLGLTDYYLIGHSVFGGLAIEVAKFQPPGLAGVIGIGATPGWNDSIIQFKNDYFERYASVQRKQRFNDLQAEYNHQKAATDSLVSVAAYYAESPKYFAEDVDLHGMQELWSGIDCNDVAVNHLFSSLLPAYDFNQNVELIKVPVLVAGGQKDYDSVPLQMWQQFSKAKQLTLLDCGPVGHWPHWEAPAKFDAGVLGWVATAKN